MTTANPIPAVLGANARGELPLESLFRALVSRRGWVASTLQLKDYLGWDRFDSVKLFGTAPRFDPNVFYLFSDESEVVKAIGRGAQFGPCAGGIDGAELFSRLPVDLEVVVIDGGSEPPFAFSIENKFIPTIKVWAEAIRFENLLANAASLTYEQHCDLFRDAPELIGFLDAKSHALVTLPGSHGMTNPAAVFTAADTMALFLNTLTVDQAASLKLHFLTDDWFDRVPTQGMDGLVVNVCGGGPVFSLRFRGDAA